MALTARNIITNAMRELGLLNAADTADANDLAFGSDKLRQLLDNLNADTGAVYAHEIASVTLTGALQPHTIGPTGATFTVAQRPETIDAANLIVNGVHVPLTIRDAAWWMGLSDPTVTGQPSDLRYDPDWPLGKLYLYPVPDANYAFEMLRRIVIAAMTLNTVFSMPPGYESMVTLTLAEDLAPGFGVQVPPLVARNAQRARARVEVKNLPKAPQLQTADAGLGGRGGYFDYKTGRVI